jgi:hypothetical protein
MTKAAAVFSSRLAHVLKRYVDLKWALGPKKCGVGNTADHDLRGLGVPTPHS